MVVHQYLLYIPRCTGCLAESIAWTIAWTIAWNMLQNTNPAKADSYFEQVWRDYHTTLVIRTYRVSKKKRDLKNFEFRLRAIKMHQIRF